MRFAFLPIAFLMSIGTVVADTSRPIQCLKEAATHHRVDFNLLLAIATVESGLNPNAVGRNTNGTQDVGLMQINDWWHPTLKKHGISVSDLRDPCVSAYIGAWILAHEIKRHGATWKAVGAYNTPNPANQIIYARKVQKQLQRQQQAGQATRR